MLGYTQVTWDNDSGEELQPWSTIKSWAHLSENEKAAAVVLGFSKIIWDNESGLQPQPPSIKKSWNELTLCGEGASVGEHGVDSILLVFVFTWKIFKRNENTI